MQAESLEVLERAEVAPAQARAIVRAIEIEIAGARDVLATKYDLTNLRADVRADLGELRVELRGEMQDLRVELRKEVADLGTALRKEMGDLRADLSRHVYVTAFGQTTVMLGFFYFFLTR